MTNEITIPDSEGGETRLTMNVTSPEAESLSKKEKLLADIDSLIEQANEMPPHALEMHLTNHDYVSILSLIASVLRVS